MIECPRCGITVTELHSVEADVASKLQAMGDQVPSQACMGCLNEMRKLSTGGTQGGVLLAQEKAKEQHRLQLWKSRVGLIKKGRSQMGQKMFSDAAISYEKYLKILDIVFEAEKGQKLTPEMFKEKARTQELTVVCSVYWDLLRIYDQLPQFGERQYEVARQLAKFIKYTPILPDIVKKADAFSRQAKNPGAIKVFLNEASEERSKCFIATSAFESADAPEVLFLRNYRDQVLLKNHLGQVFVKTYYRISPAIAHVLDKQFYFKPIVRQALRLLIKCVSR